MLLRADGMILARYPEQPGTIGHIAPGGNLGAIFADGTVTMVRHFTSDGAWRIEALRALPDFRVAVAVNRSADQVLAGWAHQGLWFGALTLAGTVAIGAMVYLIARQFQTHAALAEIRAEKEIAALNAEKIEIERARLAAEAELLKSERLSVLG